MLFLLRNRHLRGAATKLLLVLAAGLAGCTPEIGDECTSSIDCSTLGDRLCDISLPGGYCTIFNCEPDTCPDEAACVAFNQQLDPACGTVDDSRYGRFGRTFCMYVCEDTGDCRDGYSCLRPADRQASVVDLDTDTDDPQDTKICLVQGALPTLPGEPPGACYPNEPDEPLVPYVPAGGAGGSGGSGGTGGGGQGGAGGGQGGGSGGSGGT